MLSFLQKFIKYCSCCSIADDKHYNPHINRWLYKKQCFKCGEMIYFYNLYEMNLHISFCGGAKCSNFDIQFNDTE